VSRPLVVPSHAPLGDGCVVRVTPESAGWTYVGFAVHRLAAGARLELVAERRETCVVVLSGSCHFAADGREWRGAGARADVFDGPPTALYVPPGLAWSAVSAGESELAVCTAPAERGAELRLLLPEDMEVTTRGEGVEQREIRNILMAGQEAESLLVTEVVTPAGHWSSYPPHKHDVDDLPREALLEETYYHRLRGGDGFAFQRVYTDDRSLDEAIPVTDGDVVLVPRGYHPVANGPRNDLYYLNVMAGPHRVWAFSAAPGFVH
jgi:5-deoxy-glucuronate isomerase